LSYARVQATIARRLLMRPTSGCLATHLMRELGMTTEESGNRVAVIALSGELDLYTCPEFKDELLRVIRGGATLVAVDLTQTTFIDSTALGVLIRGVERLKINDGRLVVACSDPNIVKVFEVTGLDRVFSVVGSREEALAQASS
jgi:anti-sigma B factor antagonist